MIERKSLGIKYFAVLIGFLRDRPGFLEEIRQGTRLPTKIISLLVCSSLFLAPMAESLVHTIAGCKLCLLPLNSQPFT